MSLIGEAMPSSVPTSVSGPTNPWLISAMQWLRLGIVGTGVIAMAFWTYRVTLGARHLVVSAPTASTAAITSLPANTGHPEPPASPPSPRESTLTLNGVVQGVGEPFAILNGAVVHLGETIEDATLLRIGSGMAIVRRKDKEVVLRTAK